MRWCNIFGIYYLFNDTLVLILFILIPCITLYEHSCLHLFLCMWIGCIKSCMEDPSHGFLVNRWLVHSRFMGLGNPLDVVVHDLLIGRMIGLDY